MIGGQACTFRLEEEEERKRDREREREREREDGILFKKKRADFKLTDKTYPGFGWQLSEQTQGHSQNLSLYTSQLVHSFCINESIRHAQLNRTSKRTLKLLPYFKLIHTQNK